MSVLHQINQNQVRFSNATALSCNSSAEARPALTIQQVRLRIARAVYFCKIHQIEPSATRLANLAGLRKAVLLDYFIGTDGIVREVNNSLVTGKATPYTCITRRVIGNFTPINGFAYSKYETINGLHGYRLLPLSSSVIMDSQLKVGSVSGTFALLTAQLLKEYGLVHTLTGHKKALTLAAATVKLLWAISLQDGKVYHNTHALKVLLFSDKNLRIIHKSENRKCDGLFHREDGTGNEYRGSYRYLLSKRGETFIEELVHRYMDLALGESKIDIKPKDMLVKRKLLKKLHARDRVVLLSRCAGLRNGMLHIVNTIKDDQDSRVYGLMTMLSSRGRKILGYLQYDMAAALQSIVFDVLDANAPYDATKRFPLHFMMVSDRRAFRQEIADEIGKDTDWVKVALTKIDNGGSVHYHTLKKSETMMKYKDEARLLVDEFMKYVDEDIVITAKRHARIHKLDNEHAQKLIGVRYHSDGRKIFGLFFFAWTQIERDIRELMKPFFRGYCHDVHDAIASKEVVDVSLLNKELESAGFKYVRVEV